MTWTWWALAVAVGAYLGMLLGAWALVYAEGERQRESRRGEVSSE